MPRISIVLVLTGLLVPAGGRAHEQAETSHPPESCQGAFVTRGECVLAVPGDAEPFTLSISGIAYGAFEARISLRLEDVETGTTLVRCSAMTVGTMTEVGCGQSVTLTRGPLIGRCVAEGLIAGRFFCDRI